jgi:hypothetical protein
MISIRQKKGIYAFADQTNKKERPIYARSSEIYGRLLNSVNAYFLAITTQTLILYNTVD